MDRCKSYEVAERSLGYDADKKDPLIDHFMSDFTKDDSEKKHNGKIILYSAIGIVTLILISFVLLTCVIYACLRCKRRCNPYKLHCEGKWQKCFRWVFSILLLLLLPLIVYFLANAIDWTRKNRAFEKEHESSYKSSTPEKSTKLRSIERALVTDYQNFHDAAFRSVDDIISTSSQSAKKDLDSDLDSVCGTPTARQQLNETVSIMQKDIDELCVEIIMWNDFTRAIIRNMTTFLAQTKEGRAFYSRLNFIKSDSLWMQMSTLFKMSELLGLIGNIVTSIEELYNQSNMLTKNLDAVAKQVLTPYLDEVNDDLEERGKTLRALSQNLTDDIVANYAMLRSTDSFDKKRKYKAIPKSVFIFEWLCFAWIILIVFILLMALILRCCGQRWKGESERGRKRKCCSQQCGSSLFQLTVYIMSLLFLLALLPIWWNYEHGVGAYNGRCKKGRPERPIQNRYRRSVSNLSADATSKLSTSETTDEMLASLTEASDVLASADRNQSMSERADADDEAGDTAEEPTNICRNREVNAFLASNAMKVRNRMAPSPNISEATMQLEAKFTKMSPIKDKLKRNAIYADENSLQEVCNDFKIQFDLKEFIRYYNEMNSFVSKEMKNPRQDLELSHCNLYALKKHLIDPFDNHEISKLIAHISDQCKQVGKHFEGGFRNSTESCLAEVEKIERFSKDKLVGVLNDTTHDLDEMFSNGLKNYRSFASEELSRAVNKYDIGRYSECVQYAHGKNGIWIPLFLILLLFLPLIPIAIYLSRLYSCAEIRTECYCYEERLFNAIRDRLYKRNFEFESQARTHVRPCKDSSQIQRKIQSHTSRRQRVTKVPLKTELDEINRSIVSDTPRVSQQQRHSTQQPNCNVKYRIKIGIFSKPNPSELS